MVETEVAATPPNRLAVRRVGKTTLVQMCDLANDEEFVMMSAQFWVPFLDAVRHDRLKPQRDGDLVIIEVKDEPISKRVQTIRTSAKAYAAFQKAARDGRFDGLKPPAMYVPYGPWVWAHGTVESAEVKLLDGVA
jgi:hypothetical protein